MNELLKSAGEEYEKLKKEEIHHYRELFLGDDAEPAARETLFQPVPATWIEVETRAAALIRERTGDDLGGHLLKRLKAGRNVRMLSLGSGPGGVELAFAAQARSASVTCLDLNPDLIQLGRERAEREGLSVAFEVADINHISLPANEYDIVFCHASLHHILDLEHVTAAISKSLRPGGVLITVDVCARNGYLMWPETRATVQAIFKTLPPRFRINHTAYEKPRVDDEIWEADTSAVSMECIRAEHIVPLLARRFTVQHFVPYFSICRRLLDTMYGPNYDLSASLDSALLNWMWELDVHYLTTGKLKPETFFGVYAKT